MFGLNRKREEDFSQVDESSQPITISSIAELEREIQGFDLASAPASATLTPSDLYMLEQRGYRVIQVVQGNIVYSMGVRGVLQSITRAFRQGEVVPFTRMNQDARRLALNRMLREAQRLGADTVIGVVFAQEMLADALEVTVLGTAIKRIEDASKNTVEVAVSTT